MRSSEGNDEIERLGRPTGVVTFLFTDVEGSTRLWNDHPDAMTPALARHDALLRSAIENHGGYVFSTAGDSYAAAFWTPDDAVATATDMQRALAAEQWPEPTIIRVRMGIHTGTATERDGDYFGPTLNRGARIMSVGHGGQVLLSDATAKLLSRENARDLGEYRLKDLPGRERIWQVGGQAFPPLRTDRGRVGNLPTASRTFVGGEGQIEGLATSIQKHRVVTLTGVGGVGKTRLALQVATSMADSFPDGVWWCDLAPIDDPDAVAVAVASSLSVRMQAELSPTESIVDAWKERQALIVFDNCEHLLDASTALIDEICANCPPVTVIATSREPLAALEEHVWPVRSLSAEHGMELFRDRAAAADATFDPSTNVQALSELCRQLDGIPLAIELAAARIRSMTPTEMLARLDERFRLLRGGTRGGIDRHRTLTATLDWSYKLLLPAEQFLLDRLSAFAGSFNLEAVEAVCGGHGEDLDARADLLDLMSSIVDKSMVNAERARDGTRYRLLETVRQYAEGHVAERGELEPSRDRHLAHYLAVAEQARTAWLADYTTGRITFDLEWDNLRSAMQHAITRADPFVIGRLLHAVAFHAVWQLRFEVLDWAEQGLEIEGAGPDSYGTAAVLAGMVGRFDDQIRLARAGIASAPSPEHPSTYHCWGPLSGGLTTTGQPREAFAAAETAYRLAIGLGEWIEGYWAAGAAVTGSPKDHLPESARYAERAETLLATLDNPLKADILSMLARFHFFMGRRAQAIDYCKRSLELSEVHDIPWSRNIALASLARVSPNRFRFRNAISSLYEQRVWFTLWPVIVSLTNWWTEQDRLSDAAVIVGYLDSHQLTSVGERARSVLEALPDVSSSCSAGAAMNRDQLVAFVVAALDEGESGGESESESA